MSRSTTTPESVAKSLATMQALAGATPAPEDGEGMTLQQLQVQRDALRKALKRLDDIHPCCDTCSRFDFHRKCSMHGEIPAEFRQVVGECPDWRHDQCPF
jgi:hypothetical protein